MTGFTAMRLARFFSLLTVPLLAAGTSPADATAAENPVLVIGALHDLHNREPAFDYDRLRAAILAFAPDVLVLEVRPDELAERKPTPGRPEYPAVIWPLLAEMRVETVAMEPGGDIFKAIAGEAGAAFEALKQHNPEATAALSRLGTEVDNILLIHWQSAGQVQDETTASMTAGVQAAQFALVGPAFAEAQARWDGHMSEQALQAVRANPGKRVMVIASYKNRAMLERVIRDAAPQRAIAASAWFDKTNPQATSGK
jgi:hypothetical protein